MTSIDSLFVRDEWISGMLGRDVYKVADVATFSREGCEQFKLETKGNKVMAFAKVDVSDLEAVELLEDSDFLLIDTNITLEKEISQKDSCEGVWGSEVKIRFANSDDEAKVREIAGSSFEYSRFHLDRRVSNEAADEIKAEWASNYFKGNRGDAMVVAEFKGVVAGFLQLLYIKKELLVIDLISVSKSARRNRLAEAMIGYSQQHCGEFSKIRVGTQVANIAATRLYEKCGFKTAGASYVFHYHGDRWPS